MPSGQCPPSVRRGRLSGADLVATALVATAVAVAALWLADVTLTDWSTRAIALVVVALGYLACMTTQSRMAEVYGAQGQRRAPTAYRVVASLVGTAALVSGILAVLLAAETMLVVLLVAIVALWAMSTARHRTTRQALHPREL